MTAIHQTTDIQFIVYKPKVISASHQWFSGGTFIVLSSTCGQEIAAVLVRSGLIESATTVRTDGLGEVKTSHSIELCPEARRLLLREHLKHLRAKVKSGKQSVAYWTEKEPSSGMTRCVVSDLARAERHFREAKSNV